MNMLHRMTYAEVVAKAEAIKAIDPSATVYLDEKDPPYEKAHAFEPGSTIRLGTSTSGYFVAKVQGITVKWSYDLEDWGANGSGELQPRIDAARKVIGRLDAKARRDFREWLMTVAHNMESSATEIRVRADAQLMRCRALADVASTP
jgi:hypothetical protein